MTDASVHPDELDPEYHHHGGFRSTVRPVPVRVRPVRGDHAPVAGPGGRGGPRRRRVGRGGRARRRARRVAEPHLRPTKARRRPGGPPACPAWAACCYRHGR
ncbi:conserved hypothetical protein [Mycobacterium tuberculosis T17]|nr:conserved hypothetical protein [Mycobacterium tuberculosis T17]